MLERVTREGPLSSRDFEHTGERGDTSWRGWKPQKVALDCLWRCGVLHVVARPNFAKVYDLDGRVVPAQAAMPSPTEAEHVDWSCRRALDALESAAEKLAGWVGARSVRIGR